MKANPIESVRAKIAACEAEFTSLENQPRSRSDVREAVVECVAGFAAEAQARADRALRQIANGQSSRAAISAVFGRCGPATTGERAVDGVALVGFLGADTAVSVLLRRLDDVVPEGMSDETRVQRKAELAEERERLERAEEALIVESETSGTPLTRRADCRPEIVLARIGSDTRPPPKPKPEISAEQAARDLARAVQRLTPEPARSQYLAPREEV